MDQKVQFTFESRDVVKSMQLSAEGRFPVRTPYLLAFGVAVVAMSFAMFRNDDSYITQFLVPALILLLIVVALVQYVVIPWQARRHMKQAAAFRDVVTFEWGEEGIRLSGEHGVMKLRWSDLYRWSKNTDMILFYQSGLVFNLVPKRALSEEQERDIIGRLKSAGIKRR